jgi:multidrug resistance efflux pump
MRIDQVDYMLALNAQTQNVEASRARAKQANSDEQRYRGLVSSGAVSASAYDQIKAQADEAQAQLAAAESQEKT